MRHKLCRSFHPWCPGVKTRCLSNIFDQSLKKYQAMITIGIIMQREATFDKLRTVCIFLGIYCISMNGRTVLYPIGLANILSYCVPTVYPKKYAHGFVVLCFVVVMQSFIMNSYEVFIHIHQGCFAGTGAIVRLPQCQWSKPDGYGKISQCITTTKHSKAKTVCIFLGIYCRWIMAI